MNADDLMARLTTWYNQKVVAAWYRSSVVIVSWLMSLVIFLPDLIQFVFDHWDIFGDQLLPSMSPSTKSLVLGIYLSIGVPVLRAWKQKKMTEASIKQNALLGTVIPLPSSGVAPTAMDSLRAAVVAEHAVVSPGGVLDAERTQREPGPQS